MLPSADKLCVDVDLFSGRVLHLPTVLKLTSNCFAHCGITVFLWPADWPGLNPMENVLGVF